MNKYIKVLVLIGVVCAGGFLLLSGYNSDTDTNTEPYDIEIKKTITVNNSNITVDEFRDKYNIPDNYTYPVNDTIKVVD